MAFPLHNAARNGDVAGLTAQIGEGANLELRDPQASAAGGRGRCLRPLRKTHVFAISVGCCLQHACLGLPLLQPIGLPSSPLFALRSAAPRCTWRRGQGTWSASKRWWQRVPRSALLLLIDSLKDIG